MPLNELAGLFPDDVAREIRSCASELTEIRIRAGKPVRLITMNSIRDLGISLDSQALRKLALRMMDHSYYACEHELTQGYFTMKNGCRVGVGGTYAQLNRNSRTLQAIGSLCIRIARAVPDCALPLVNEMISDKNLHSTLILSRPGMGKTTMLRDAARLLSRMGYMVGIADERSEIAACRFGVPTMDVGLNTDVVDGCPKAQAIEHLIRSMAPQIIITDEIGNSSDAVVLREAARKGVAILASAHAGCFEAFEASALGDLLTEGLFPLAALLEGKPGNISAFRSYAKGGSLCI